MIDKDKFEAIFRTVLADAGYRKKGQTWYRIGDEVIISIGLQNEFKSQSFLNIGFIIRKVSGDRLVPVHKSDFYFRAERLFPQYFDQINLLLRKNYPYLNDEDHSAALRQFLSDELVPSCNSLQGMDNLRNAYREDKLKKGIIQKDARQLLELP